MYMFNVIPVGNYSFTNCSIFFSMKLHKQLNLNSIILLYVFRISVITQRLHYISEAEKLRSRRLINRRQITNMY